MRLSVYIAMYAYIMLSRLKDIMHYCFQNTEAKILSSLKLDSEDLQVEIKVPMDTGWPGDSAETALCWLNKKTSLIVSHQTSTITWLKLWIYNDFVQSFQYRVFLVFGFPITVASICKHRDSLGQAKPQLRRLREDFEVWRPRSRHGIMAWHGFAELTQVTLHFQHLSAKKATEVEWKLPSTPYRF